MKKMIRYFAAAIFVLFVGSAFAAAPVTTGVDMYAMPYKAPARIASDSAGRLYITDTTFDSVHVYANNGTRIYSMNGIPSPLGIAADPSGGIYVSDSRKGSVGLYAGGTLLYKLGSGDGEFLFPNDVALSENGNVYVTDSKAGLVKVYSANGGGLLFSFGAGILLYPTGIAVDDAAGEVFVLSFTDLYIRIFDLAGNLKRSIRGGGGMMGGKIASPLGIAVDETRIYIADSYHCAVAVYDRASGIYLSYIGKIGTGLTEFMTPTDLTLDRDGKMFVTNTNNQRIEVIGLDTFSGLRTDPAEMTFSVYAGGYSVTQNMNLTSAGADTNWTASASVPWVSLSSSSGTTPSTVGITVDPAGLSAGTYDELVTFVTPEGTEAVFQVRVLVAEPNRILSVSPLTLNLVYQIGSSVLPEGTVLVHSSDIPLNWTAVPKESWIRLDKTSGSTPDSIQVQANLTRGSDFGGPSKVTPPIAGRSVGSVLVSAAGAQGSPAVVEVVLDVVSAGNIRVNTNIDEASFTITGPQNLTGSGKTWTAENVKTGTYTITFRHVSGFRKPAARSFAVQSGRVSEITVSYMQEPAATHILAASGNPNSNAVAVLTISGAPVLQIIPFPSGSGTKAIAADLNADGIDEIVVSNTKDCVKVFDAAGRELAARTIPGAGMLEIAQADFEGDGRAEIIASYTIGFAQARRIVLFSNLLSAAGSMVDMAAFSGAWTKPFPTSLSPLTLAAGDVNGDGIPELITAEKTELSVYRVLRTGNRYVMSALWKMTLNGVTSPFLGAGDIDDDGVDEIAIGEGASAGSGSNVKILKGDGTDFVMTINAFGDLGYGFGVSVGLGDIDGDGKADVVTGAGPGAANEAMVRLYDSAGQLISTIKTAEGFFGVNAALGRLGE